MTTIRCLKIMAAGTAIASVLAISQQSAIAQEAVIPAGTPIVSTPAPAPARVDAQDNSGLAQQLASPPAKEETSPATTTAPAAQAAPKAARHHSFVRRDRHHAPLAPATAAHATSPAEAAQQASNLSSASAAASPAYTVVNTMGSTIPLAQDFEKKRATATTPGLNEDGSLYLGIGTSAALLLGGGILYGFYRRRKALAAQDTEDPFTEQAAQSRYETTPDQPSELPDSPTKAATPVAPANPPSSDLYHLGHVTIPPQQPAAVDPAQSPNSQTTEMPAEKTPSHQTNSHGTIRFSYTLRPRTS